MNEAVRTQAYVLLRTSHLSQRDLARLTGISEDHLSGLLRGNRRGSVKSWTKIADALGVSLSDPKETPVPQTPAEIADRVLLVFYGRKGFSWWWDDLADANQQDILAELADQIAEALGAEATQLDPVTVFTNTIAELSRRWPPVQDLLEDAGR